MKLRYRLLIGFSIVSLIFVAIIAVNLEFLRRTSARMQIIVQEKLIIERRIQNSYLIIMDIHARIWDAMLFNPEKRKEAIQDLDKKAKDFYDNIFTLIETIPEEESFLQEIRITFGKYYQFGSTILELKNLQEFQSRIDTVNKFKENKSCLMSLLDETANMARKSFENDLFDLNNRFRFFFILNLVATVIVIIMAVIMSLFLATLFTKPIDHLTEVAEKLGNGNFKVRAEMKMRGEFKTLASTFNFMAEKINKILKDLHTEIAERKEAEEELRRARNYLNNVFNSLSSMLISIDREGIITQWNIAAENITGISAGKAIGRKVWEIMPFLKKFEDKIGEIINKKKSASYYREIYQNGSKRYLDVLLHPLAYNGSSGAVIRLDDVTELEKKDEQLRQLQKMDTVRLLAGGLAHDFNNILTAIIGTVSIMKHSLQTGTLEIGQIEDDIQVIENAANRASDIVKNLLFLSHKQELSFSPNDLNKIIESVIKICKNTIDKSVEIKVSYCMGEAMINADFTQIEEVLLNLCINAWHAMTLMRKPGEKQGGVLSISVEKFYADHSFCTIHPQSREGYYYLLKVADTGVGMDQQTMSRIFDPFFTTKNIGKGTGLGLAIVLNIIQLHKGFIDVYSEVGMGSEFKIYLPSLEIYEKAETKPDQTIYQGSGLILVVDDEASIRKVASEILEKCGYSVITAADGDKAIKIFKEKHLRIKLVLLDIAMPKMSGLEVFQKMKKVNPEVKVLVVSGFRQDKRISEAIREGARGFIQKPYTMAELSKKIKEVLK